MSGEHKRRIAPAEARANQAAPRTLTAPKPYLSHNKCLLGKFGLGSIGRETHTNMGFKNQPPALENFEAKARQLSAYRVI